MATRKYSFKRLVSVEETQISNGKREENLMFNIGDKVKINWTENERFHGLEGAVISKHDDLDVEMVYRIRYANGNGGMFTESQLETL